MKKALAVILALIMALSVSSIAFAKDEESSTMTCPYCGNVFHDEGAYNDHIKICYEQRADGDDQFDYKDGSGTNWGKYDKLVNVDLSDLINYLLDAFGIQAGTSGTLADIVLRAVDFIENMINLVAGTADAK